MSDPAPLDHDPSRRAGLFPGVLAAPLISRRASVPAAWARSSARMTPPFAASSPSSAPPTEADRKRFLQEGQRASALNHPASPLSTTSSPTAAKSISSWSTSPPIAP